MRGWVGLQDMHPVSLALGSVESGHPAQMWEVGYRGRSSEQSDVQIQAESLSCWGVGWGWGEIWQGALKDCSQVAMCSVLTNGLREEEETEGNSGHGEGDADFDCPPWGTQQDRSHFKP